MCDLLRLRAWWQKQICTSYVTRNWRSEATGCSSWHPQYDIILERGVSLLAYMLHSQTVSRISALANPWPGWKSWNSCHSSILERITFSGASANCSKPWTPSIFGYINFPDFSLGIPEDAYLISTWDVSWWNPTSGKKVMACFLNKKPKFPLALLMHDCTRASTIKYCYPLQNEMLCLY